MSESIIIWGLILIFVVFILSREFRYWYLKINERIEYLEKMSLTIINIENYLSSINSLLYKSQLDIPENKIDKIEDELCVKQNTDISGVTKTIKNEKEHDSEKQHDVSEVYSSFKEKVIAISFGVGLLIIIIVAVIISN